MRRKIDILYSKGNKNRMFIIDTILNIGQYYRIDDVFSDFVSMCAISLSNIDFTHRDEREQEYLRLINKYEKKYHSCFTKMFAHLVLEIESSIENDRFEDILGDLFHELGLGNERAGQFFTPGYAAEVMATMTIDNQEKSNDKDYITVCEPMCGSGVMIIKAAKAISNGPYDYQNKMVVMAVDIDIRCVQMAYVQFSLYGIPAVVIHGNSLSNETWSRWYTPLYLLNGWIWKETFTLDNKVCIEDVRIKCALEPLYGAFLKINSYVVSEGDNQKSDLEGQSDTQSIELKIAEQISLDNENCESEKLRKQVKIKRNNNKKQNEDIFATQISLF